MIAASGHLFDRHEGSSVPAPETQSFGSFCGVDWQHSTLFLVCLEGQVLTILLSSTKQWKSCLLTMKFVHHHLILNTLILLQGF